MAKRRRKRRHWSDDEKREIVAQTRIPGVSVSRVARRYDVNASLVFKWLALASIPESVTVAHLIEELNASDVPDQINAVKLLAKFGDLAIDAVPALVDKLGHKNRKLRKNAVIALGQIGKGAKAALPTLEEMLDNRIAVMNTRRSIRQIRGF